jgi:hypothetical protein
VPTIHRRRLAGVVNGISGEHEAFFNDGGMSIFAGR